jgi:hypothetical protein
MHYERSFLSGGGKQNVSVPSEVDRLMDRVLSERVDF